MKRLMVVSLILIWLTLSSSSFGQAAAVGESARVSNNEDTITLELRDVDVRTALDALFKKSGKNYSVDPNVSGTVPAVSFKDVPFETALRNLTRTAGLVYRVDNSGGREIYIISKKPETPSPMVSNPTPSPAALAPVDQPIEREVIIEKIPLFHTSASEMLAILGGGRGREYAGLGSYGVLGYGMGAYYGGYGGYGYGYPGYGSYGRYGTYGGYPSYGYGGYGGYPYGGYGNYGVRSYGGYSTYPGYGTYGGYGWGRGW